MGRSDDPMKSSQNIRTILLDVETTNVVRPNTEHVADWVCSVVLDELADPFRRILR